MHCRPFDCRHLVENNLLFIVIFPFSAQALDVILSAPEHHDKHFLNYIANGFQKRHNRLHLTWILFYGIRRSAAPSWIRRFCKHTALKELLTGMGRDTEPHSLIAGLMTVSLLVTAASYDVGKYCLPDILDTFWRVAHWSPQKPEDGAMRDYIRVALYSLFTRLYALFPCNVVHYIRNHAVGHSEKPFFKMTLQPMIERVRLHPMLLACNRESEIGNSINIKDNHQAALEWGRISLDPTESSCEEPPLLIDPEVCSATFVLYKCWVHETTENFFWSPSHSQSPNLAHVDVPKSYHPTPLSTPLTTPIYTKTPLRVSINASIPESPPEAAIEATPDVTPLTTPHLMDSHRQKLADAMAGKPQSSSNHACKQLSLSKDFLSDDSRIKPGSAIMNRLNAVMREQKMTTASKGGEAPPMTAAGDGETLGKAVLTNGTADGGHHHHPATSVPLTLPKSASSKNILSTTESNNQTTSPPHHLLSPTDAKSQESVTTPSTPLSDSSEKAASSSSSVNNFGGKLHPLVEGSGINSEGSDATLQQKTSDRGRARKHTVVERPSLDMLQFSASHPLMEGTEDSSIACEVPVAAEGSSVKPEDDEQRKSSTETSGGSVNEEEDNEDQSLGLGPPSDTSMKELVKTATSQRLRFLSQIMPPLNDRQLETIIPKEKKAVHSKETGLARARSFGSLDDVKVVSLDIPLPKAAQCRNKAEVSTQTQAVWTAEDPYEKLLETFVANRPPIPSQESDQTSSLVTESPHTLLENYIQRKIVSCSEPLLNFDVNKLKTVDDSLKSQIYAMYSLMLLERQKRTVHANRNRRILAVAKKTQVILLQKESLERKTEEYYERERNIKSHNLYLSSCYQRMKLARDRDIREKELVLDHYDPETNSLNLDDKVLTSLSRTVRTSKDKDDKDKIVVILHRPNVPDVDVEKDALYRYLGVMGKHLEEKTEANRALKTKVCQLQEESQKWSSEELNIDTLQHDKEMLRQQVSVLLLQINLKDELLVQLQESLDVANKELKNISGLHALNTQTLQEYEKYFKEGVTGSADENYRESLREAENKLAEKDFELEKLKKELAAYKKEKGVLEKDVNYLRKQNLDLEMNFRQISGQNEVLKKEYDYIARRSGFDRTAPKLSDAGLDKSHSKHSKSFISTGVSEDLRELEITSVPAKRDLRQGGPSRKGSTKE